MSDDYMVDDLSAFGGEKRKVGVGYTFEGDDAGFDDGEIAVSAGDVAVFDDPDSGMHTGQCELVHSEVTVAYVTELYAVEYSWRDSDGYAVEIGVSGAAIGRVGVTDAYVGIVTEDGIVGGKTDDRDTRDMAGRLVDHDEYQKYYRWTAHLGEDGVPADLWDAYADSGRSGPDCPVCTGEEGQDGVVVTGE